MSIQAQPFVTIDQAQELIITAINESQNTIINTLKDYMEGKFATKDDFKRFATKEDLKRFATKNDLKRFATKDDLKKFATKDDLKRFATKDDLKRFATKDDIADLNDKISDLQYDMGHVKKDIKHMRGRIDIIEANTSNINQRFTHNETNIEQNTQDIKNLQHLVAKP